MTECCYPGCLEPTDRRDDGTYACSTHTRVRVSSVGSWLGEGHGHGKEAS